MSAWHPQLAARARGGLATHASALVLGKGKGAGWLRLGAFCLSVSLACSRSTASPVLTPSPAASTQTAAGAQRDGFDGQEDPLQAEAGLASGPGPDAGKPGPPPDCNVVLLSIDSLRADMPWNGYPRPIAPRLTNLEGQAVSFTNAYSMSSYTSMSLGGLLAGRLPSELVRSGYFFGTYKKDVFFPQLLHKAGVHTMGVMAHMYFKSAGFDVGFDEWQLVPGIVFDANTDRDITSPSSEELSEKVLGDPANDSRRFFFWAHFMDPHDQYLRHQGIDWGHKARDLYDAEITFADQHIGKLLDFIATRPWASRTVLIVTSDHGEEFGEHGMWRHGFELWNTMVHVPLFVIAPGVAPKRIPALRSAIDLAPTILDLFGIAADPGMEGKSLVSEIYGAPAADRDVIVDLPMTSNNGRRRALVSGDEKLICWDDDVHCKLFHLATDPLEQSGVTRGPEYRAMKTRYDQAAKSIQEVAPYACTGDCLNAPPKSKDAAP